MQQAREMKNSEAGQIMVTRRAVAKRAAAEDETREGEGGGGSNKRKPSTNK